MEINYEQEDEYRMCRHFPAGVCLERSCRKQRYNTIQRPRDAIGSLSSRRSFVWFCMQDYVV